MSDRVWVCLCSEFARDTYRAFKAKDACPACHDGICGTDNKPCDAVEYAPVKRGQWSIIKSATRQIATCSVCNSVSTYHVITLYCPHCGARMGDE